MHAAVFANVIWIIEDKKILIVLYRVENANYVVHFTLRYLSGCLQNSSVLTILSLYTIALSSVPHIVLYSAQLEVLLLHKANVI